MKDVRSKIAIGVVIFGLGGLGGFAIASNPAQHGRAPAAKIASQTAGGRPVTTGGSGAVSGPALNAPASQVLPRRDPLGGEGRDD